MNKLKGYKINISFNNGCTECDNDVELTQFFCRTGGKGHIIKEIFKLIPNHKIYVEPFVGGGSLYWGKKQATKSIINDLDKELIDGYKLLKSFSINENPANFPLQNTVGTIQAIVDKQNPNKYEKLMGYLYKSCNSFGCKGFGRIYKDRSQINKINKINDYIKKIKNTTIESQDYKKIIQKYDSPQTFFFLDPPYEASESLYKEFEIDYQEMNRILLNIKGLFLLTINDSPSIRKIFNNFNIKKIIVPPTAHRSANVIGASYRNELIITNYTI